jgi:hypothetical protein
MSKPFIDNIGTQIWRNDNGKLHRENGPAYISLSGYKAWYKNGLRHREDGPAIILTDDSMAWYINGKRKLKNSSFQKAAKLSDEDMIAIVLKYGNITYYDNITNT